MKKKAQTVLEYAVLVAVIAAALIAMHEYVNRAINARLKDVQDELYGQTPPGVGMSLPPGGVPNP